MSKHTPGPWFYDDGESGKYFPHVVLGGNNPKAGHYIVVNTCGGGNGGRMSECRANACLIAAAPDLLEALKALASQAYVTMTGGHQDLIDSAEETIAKAEGR